MYKEKICNKCEDVFITIVDGVFSGSEICPTCLNTDYKYIKEEKK
jgi:formylmethanofuran dehydrogenase subunit E|tara:strand:+ start:1243 stop:1377 length:135 start_codon:yes stop_codon:yes gene_type:complete